MAAPDPRTVAVVAAGGVVGSLGRYAVGLALPHAPFSTLAVDTVRLGDGHEQLALLYVAATFVVGILAVGLGILIGRRTWPDIAGAQEDS